MVEILANVYLLEAIINLVRLFTRGTNIRKFWLQKDTQNRENSSSKEMEINPNCSI